MSGRHHLELPETPVALQHVQPLVAALVIGSDQRRGEYLPAGVTLIPGVNPLVAPQGDGQLEGFSALAADERFQVRVDDLVGLESLLGDETFVTLVTPEGFLSGVVDPVLFHLRQCFKSLPTHVTLMRFLTRVCASVDRQGAGLSETLPTLVTLVGFLPRVQPLVFLQTAGHGEGRSALHTAVRFLSGVNPLMELQGVQHLEGGAAVAADVWSLLTVDDLVGLQPLS